MFALMKSEFPPSGFGRIWAAPYWNMSKVGMPLLCQNLAKSVWQPTTPPPPAHSQILHCKWWLLNIPKFVLGEDYVYPSDFGKIWRIDKIWMPKKWKNQCPPKSSMPSDDFRRVPNMYLTRIIFSSATLYMIHGLWPFITISSGPPWSSILMKSH